MEEQTKTNIHTQQITRPTRVSKANRSKTTTKHLANQKKPIFTSTSRDHEQLTVKKSQAIKKHENARRQNDEYAYGSSRKTCSSTSPTPQSALQVRR
jgi:hypothetical protein